MTPMILTLTFYIDEPKPLQDLDDLSDIVREAIDEKVGESDYMVQDVGGLNVEYELNDLI
jgi:hypothetical protein